MPCPSPGVLPNTGIEPRSPTLQADSLPAKLPEKPLLPCLPTFIPLRYHGTFPTQLVLPYSSLSPHSSPSLSISLYVSTSVSYTHASLVRVLSSQDHISNSIRKVFKQDIKKTHFPLLSTMVYSSEFSHHGLPSPICSMVGLGVALGLNNSQLPHHTPKTSTLFLS